MGSNLSWWPRRATYACLFLLLLVLAVVLVDGQTSLEDKRAQMQTILKTISRDIEKNFYDPALRGLNWRELTRKARERISSANSEGDMMNSILALVDKLEDPDTFFFLPVRTSRRFGFKAKAFGEEVRVYQLSQDGAAAAVGLALGDRLNLVNGRKVDRKNFDLSMLYLRLFPVRLLAITFSRGGEPPRTVGIHGRIEQEQFVRGLTRGEEIYQLICEPESQKVTFEYGYEESGIGYLHLPFFTDDRIFQAQLIKRVEDRRAIVVDLRGSPGGSIEALRHFTSFFATQSTVIANLAGRENAQPLRVKPQSPGLSTPLFILVDSQTAGTAEAFARHFQRSGRAVVLGDRTPGRVTVRKTFHYAKQLGKNRTLVYGLCVSTAHLVFPDETEFEGRGINPDHFCIPGTEDLVESRDSCLALAVRLARETLNLPLQGDREQEVRKETFDAGPLQRSNSQDLTRDGDAAVYNITEPGITNPVPLVQPKPSYTDEAKAAKIQGPVSLKAIIRKDGRVDSFWVLESPGYGLDEKAIEEIAENWRFRPGTLNGKPVDIHATIKVQFTIGDLMATKVVRRKLLK